MNTLGLAQSGGTCWFHSSLNLFLLSDDGFKILWDKLQKVYKKMSPMYKAWFESNINAPCPPRLKSLTTINSIYFWKFLDQFMCSIGGPGRLWRKHERNQNLISRVKWNRENIKEAPLTAGGVPRRELPKLLRHIGFVRGDYHYHFISRTAPPGNYKFILHPAVKPHDIPLTKGPYRLSGAIFLNRNKSKTQGHVWTCIRKGNRGYIFDSAYPAELHSCNWWNENELNEFFDTSSMMVYNWGNNWLGVRDGYFDVVMYSRSSYVDTIAPSCRRVYRPLNKGTLNIANELVGNMPNIGAEVNKLNVPPAVKAHLRTYESVRVPLNSATFNAIVRSSNTQNKAMNTLKNLELTGYKVIRSNNANSNWQRFIKALRNKFAPPLSKNKYETALLHAKSKGNALNKIEGYANFYKQRIDKNSNNYKNFIRRLNNKFSKK